MSMSPLTSHFLQGVARISFVERDELVQSSDMTQNINQLFGAQQHENQVNNNMDRPTRLG